MVRIAIAGGTGQVAREVIDALLAARKHHITVLSRRTPAPTDQSCNVDFRTVDYNNKDSLVKALDGVHTLLSFIVVHTDPENRRQKNLIDAAVSAGVKRFAPSEWAGSDLTGMSFHANKAGIRAYLEGVNKEQKILEYTLFQPGLFLDYLAAPYQTSTHVTPLQTPFNFQHRRAIAVAERDPTFTFTSVHDLAAIVARAVEYDGEWPTAGGISGNKLSVSALVALGEKVRGGPFTIDVVHVDDLEAGKLKVSWLPAEGHQSFTGGEGATKVIEAAYIGILLNGVHGGWDVGDEFNRIFADHRFEPIEGFVERAWLGKP